MTGSRFLQPKASRFFRKVATLAQAALADTASRFLAGAPRAGRRLSRIVHRVPLVSKFLAFFAPETLVLDTPEPINIATPAPVQQVPHIAPIYNRRARRPRGPRLTI